MSFFTWKKAAWFAGGIAAAGAVKAASHSKGVRKAAVSGVAKCMAVNDSIQNATQNLMDDADDLRAEAKRKQRIDSAVAERMAELEAKVREEVESEIDAAPAAEA